MFHLQSLELLHWDYCQRLSLPLDGAIITIAGPNGSGKTTLLDAMRTLLGLECSGGRSYKTYARHANADSAWLRAVVDNRPRGAPGISRPFARCLLYTDQVTLACRIERNGGDWQRRYLMAEGDVPIEKLVDRRDKDWLGIEHWRKRLEGAGLSPRHRPRAGAGAGPDRPPLRVLAQGAAAPGVRRLRRPGGAGPLRGGARHQRQLAEEVEAAERELAHGKAQLADLDGRVNLYQQHQAKVRERETLATEVMPVLAWAEERLDIAARLARAAPAARARTPREARQRRRATGTSCWPCAGARRSCRSRAQLESDKRTAQAAHAAPPATPSARWRNWSSASRNSRRSPRSRATRRSSPIECASWRNAIAAAGATGTTLPPTPGRPGRALAGCRGSDRRRRRLTWRVSSARCAEAGIAHHLMADVIEITDERWRAAAEGVLRGSRWVVVLGERGDEGRALALAERERYRHYVVADAAPAPARADAAQPAGGAEASPRPCRPGCCGSWRSIQRVDSTGRGRQGRGRMDHARRLLPRRARRPQRVGRPGRPPVRRGGLASRKDSIERRLAGLDRELTQVAQEQQRDAGAS